MSSTRHILSILFGALLLASCGPPIPTTPEEDPTGPPPLSDLTGQALAAQTLGPDPYEIGTSWYDYTQTTHVLTPREHVYVLERQGEPTAAFEISSYYDDRGESGTFSMRFRRREAGVWGEVQTLQTSKNVKQAQVCIDEAMAEVACDAPGSFLIFRIVRRALPDAGFAVKDPGVFLRSQFQNDPNQDRLYFFESPSLESLDMDTLDLEARGPRPSSAADPVHSRVGWLHDSPDTSPRDDIHFQVTTSLHAALWRVTGIETGPDSTTLTVDVLCQRVDFARQRDFDPDARATFTITLPTDSTYSGARVSLCDADSDTGVSGQTHDVTDTPFSGLWPEDPAFDLFVEQVEGRIAIRLAPGNLLWNWSQSEAAQIAPATMDDPLDPGAVWDTFYAR